MEDRISLTTQYSYMITKIIDLLELHPTCFWETTSINLIWGLLKEKNFLFQVKEQCKRNSWYKIEILYISDISVFIGARSDVGQSDWFWDNETMISDTTYPASNTSLCHQMTWPLTYDDRINLRGKLCEDEAYFMCQVECKILNKFLHC